MLEVGCQHGPPGDDLSPGLSLDETYSHFGAWCITSSPLTLSHDVNDDKVMDEVWPIISNREAIAINQAWAGHSGSPFLQSAEIVRLDSVDWQGPKTVPIIVKAPRWQYFYKPLGGGRVAVLMMNHGNQSDTLRLDMQDVPQLACHRCRVRDVWAQRDLHDGVAIGVHEALIPSHGTAFLVLSPDEGSAASPVRPEAREARFQQKDVQAERGAAVAASTAASLAFACVFAAAALGLAAAAVIRRRLVDRAPFLADGALLEQGSAVYLTAVAGDTE